MTVCLLSRHVQLQGWRPLHWAAFYAHHKIVEYLLTDARAHIDAPNNVSCRDYEMSLWL